MSNNEGFFGNMLGYEIVLFFFGAILMLVVIAGFIYQMKKDRLKISYGLFMLLPLAFMGFPAFEVISFMDNLFELEKYSQELAQNPDDVEVKKIVEDLAQEVSESPNRSDRQVYAISNARIALGDVEGAADALDHVDPGKAKTKFYRARIEVLQSDRSIMSNPELQVTDQAQQGADLIKASPDIGVRERAALERIDQRSRGR